MSINKLKATIVVRMYRLLFTGLLLVRIIFEACQVFTNAWVRILRMYSSNGPGNSLDSQSTCWQSTHDWLSTLAMNICIYLATYILWYFKSHN